METAITNSYYWNMLKDLSDDMKIDLIDRLVKSLVHKREKVVDYAGEFYGIWKDDEFPDAKEMVKEIREARTFKDDVEAF